jgi:hypothetical protein
MCCFLTALLLVGPRLGILVWTTLMYIAIYPGGIMGFDWILLGLGVFADMSTYFGGYRNRERVPYGETIP